MAISVDQDPELEAAIDALIETGRYGSRIDVLRQGVRLLQKREAKLAALEAALAEGLADIEAGRVYSLEEAFAMVEADLDLLSRPTAGFAEE